MNKVMLATTLPKSGNIQMATARFIEDSMRSTGATLVHSQCNWIMYGRNGLVDIFLKGDYTHLFWVDADTVPPGKTVEYFLKADKDIIGGITPMLMDNGLMWNYQIKKNESPACGSPLGDETYQVDRLGGTTLLVKRKVYEALEQPCYEMRTDENGNNVSNDFNFCDKAKDSGFEIWVNTRCKCNHINNVDLLYFANLMTPATALQGVKGS